MLKALFKKQMLEVNTWLIQDKKKGTQRSKGGMVFLILVYTVLFVMLGAVFYMVGNMLCGPLVSLGLGWMYFSMMGLIAILLGVFGSVFNTYATLYCAKDNELLLSLPVPPTAILSVRLIGVWMWGLIYEAIVFIPTLIVYWKTTWMNGTLGVLAVLFGVLLMVVLSLFILTLSCLLGWVVAKISAKLKHKSVVTVLASLVFLGVYYYVYFRAYEMLQNLLLNAQIVGKQIKGAAYPVYLMGRAGEGNPLSMIIFTLSIALLFILTWLVLSRSFLKIATANQGIAKKQYKETPVRKHSISSALLIKERRRFLSSAVYMLNCGLGTLILPIAAVFILIKGAYIREIVGQIDGMAEIVPLLACAALCTMSSMNDITAPSVSLEGKHIWLVQSLPVSAWQVLKAKLGLHLILTEIPTLLCAACVAIALRPGVFSSIMIVLLPAAFVLLSASFGLVINLKVPNLKWTDETVPVKQSMGVMLALFGGWAVVVALGGLYMAVRKLMSPNIYLLLCIIVLGAASTFLLVWLKKHGTRIFAEL